MSLRQKIVLLGFVAIASLAVILWREHGIYQAQADSMAQIQRNVDTVRSLSLAIHELQKERGQTLVGLKKPENRALAAQMEKTDLALRSIDAGSVDSAALRRALDSLRLRMAGQAPDSVALLDGFNAIIRQLLDVMRRLTDEPEFSLGKGIISAHRHLAVGKEYLGQIRATVGFWIEHPLTARQTAASLARLKGAYDEELRKFRLTAAPDLREALDRHASDATARTLHHTLDAIIALDGPMTTLDAASWWNMITASMDHLKALEDRSLDLIGETAEEKFSRFRRAINTEIAIVLTASVLILALAVSTALSLLRALDLAVSSIDRIAASKDFSSRITVASSDEISRISLRFNELLEIAERLLVEKDYLAKTDPLTGISNRLHFAQAFHEEAARKGRTRTPMALIIFDVDHFKRINDRYGHNAGDEVLKTLARLVGGQIRTTDLLGRWGGEEFVLLLRDNDCDNAVQLAEKLRGLVARHEFPAVGNITCSFGVATWRPGETEKDLVARADEALYAAKQGGRDQVRCSQGLAQSCPGHAACRSLSAGSDSPSPPPAQT